MFLSRVVPLGLVLGITACTSATVLRLDPMPRSKKPPDSIRLIGQEPERPYTVIAIVSARAELTGLRGGSVGLARNRLLKEAARLGGDAVLLDISSMTHVGSGITGKVIDFTDSAAAN